MFLMVTFAASVFALVIRVVMNTSIAGHHASTVFFRRVVSGMSAQATNLLKVARSARAWVYSGVTVAGRSGRGSSTSPSKRCSTNRDRHLPTVGANNRRGYVDGVFIVEVIALQD